MINREKQDQNLTATTAALAGAFVATSGFLVRALKRGLEVVDGAIASVSPVYAFA